MTTSIMCCCTADDLYSAIYVSDELYCRGLNDDTIEQQRWRIIYSICLIPAGISARHRTYAQHMLLMQGDIGDVVCHYRHGKH